ncbi:MAG: diphthamide biosynthesis enzyme Dph2 [Candidatus Micrarchaeia archaeon]
MKILLQFPEGLKQHAMAYAEKLAQEGNEVFVSASPSFGACDLAIDEARKIGADKLVHFGHAEFKRADFNVEYVEYGIDASLDLLPKSLEMLEGYSAICLLTTVQHIHQIKSIEDFYSRHGKRVVLNTPNGFAKYKGQLLGCDVGNVASLDKQVDAFVYFGGGLFHPLGALLQTTKPFVVIDPFQNTVKRIDYMREEQEKAKKARIARAALARNFGILVSTKIGQYNMALAKILKNKIQSAGKKAVILVSNTFDFDSLNNAMEIEAFVNTACPRLVTEDHDRLNRPLLSPDELMLILDSKSNARQSA